MAEFHHKPVLFHETIDALAIKLNGIYVDCTAGGGGHASAILEKLDSDGRLIAIDQDPEAVAVLRDRFGNDSRVTVVHRNFSEINDILEELNISAVDGILADLGVSSHQLDTDERGFSFHRDAPLDMRMSMDGPSAADLVNTATKQELQRIIYTYGEEKFAPSIAANIVKYREKKPIETTFELVEIIKDSMPMKAKRDGHPARRTFQALRIEVNGELDRLDAALDRMFEALKSGGILAIITFHSLEDKLVKKRFQSYCEGCVCPADFPVCVCGRKPKGKLPFKSKAASQDELKENFRAHSARLRAIEKL